MIRWWKASSATTPRVLNDSGGTDAAADKVAVVYGAGGPIGGAIARHFAAAGALVISQAELSRSCEHRSRRSAPAGAGRAPLWSTRSTSRRCRGWSTRWSPRRARLDVSVNVIGLGDVQKPLRELTLAEFLSTSAPSPGTPSIRPSDGGPDRRRWHTYQGVRAVLLAVWFLCAVAVTLD
jgi:NAD(P)-dependent dehydrogenase (short-subunit alcohol dehydrogenase family)